MYSLKIEKITAETDAPINIDFILFFNIFLIYVFCLNYGFNNIL